MHLSIVSTMKVYLAWLSTYKLVIGIENQQNRKTAAYALDMETFERIVSLNGEKIEGQMLNHVLENLLGEVTK